MGSQAVALKEWASVIQALKEGRQALIMRKGGIAEETRQFELAYPRFYLFPTYEHQKKHLMKEAYQHLVETSTPSSLTIDCVAVAEQEFLIDEEDKLEALMDLHIWTEAFAAERLRWKKKQPLHLIPLRIYRLPEAHSLSMEPEYEGCKSWIEVPLPALSDDILEQSSPVLNETAYEDLLGTLRERLSDR
ncbi:DUF1802 family protein [Marinicrinis sediminis]|uniref:DUF1802 family protein n=1 Tax=Marinicrinis sediminis TaxID=1652465 RepID=A0ABW5R9W9_9BACL